MRCLACAVLVVSSSTLGACSRSAESRPAPAASASQTPKGVLALGEPITSRLLPLADLARSPARYENQIVATTGKVTAVCQAMGCWMEMRDESGQAHVRMHGHSFFVPKTAAGHVARVQARVLLDKNETCEDSPPPKDSVAKVELDATGIELD